MAVRRPVYVNGDGNLQEMTSAMVTLIKDRARYQYGANPSVTLSQVGSGGSLTQIADTRLQAGAYSTSVFSFPSEATTAEPSVVTVNYQRLDEAAASTSFPTDTSNRRYPLYVNASNNLQAMSQDDMMDTFIHDAIDTLTDGTDQPGTYRIYNADTLAGHTLVSATPVFIDSRANTAEYTASGIPETLDQPTTITSFYLMKTNNIAAPTITMPARFDGNNVTANWLSDFDTILGDLIRHAAAGVAGTRIRYNINGSGNNRGTAMTDTRLNGSGNYQTRFVNSNDYRAQEFPNGTPTTINTYNLKINQT